MITFQAKPFVSLKATERNLLTKSTVGWLVLTLHPHSPSPALNEPSPKIIGQSEEEENYFLCFS